MKEESLPNRYSAL